MKKNQNREKNAVKLQKKEMKQVQQEKITHVFASSRCNICGAFIPEGDDYCDNGHKAE